MYSLGGQVDSFFCVQGDAHQGSVNERWQIMSRCCVMFAVTKAVQSMIYLSFCFHCTGNREPVHGNLKSLPKHHSKHSAISQTNL